MASGVAEGSVEDVNASLVVVVGCTGSVNVATGSVAVGCSV